MSRFSYLSIPFLLLITMLMFPRKLAAAPYYHFSFCSDATMSSNNSQFESNLNKLLHILSSTATSNSIRFYNTSVANGTNDAVYGLFLCYGYQNATSCSECVKAATTTDLPKTYCPNTNVAVIWYEECMVRYSNEPLYGRMAYEPKIYMMNELQGGGRRYNKNLAAALYNLGDEAANDPKGNKYATKFVTFSSSPHTIYCMAQCTPDLTFFDCERCLKMSIRQLDIQHRGSRVYASSCFVRYEIYAFFDGVQESLSPSALASASPTTTPLTDASHPASSQFIGRKRQSSHIIRLFVAIPTAIAISISLLFVTCWICMRKRKAREVEATKAEIDEIKMVESLQYKLSTISIATRNFSTNSKLGEGGFGEVYKGALEGGQNIAVRRLSKSSGQGVAEFKTEAVLVAKLQHKNLVKLLGYCVESTEKILVYEFVPNSNLDRYLFDQAKKAYLDWQTRFKIILAVARGLLYLHEDSRDLKPSNILLDEAMNPKISDFGLAKLFGEDETQGDTTKRIVGTYGYMAPEYAITGHYSVKSDVYSFGVIMLEIVSGQRSRFYGPQEHEEALLHRVWRLWSEEKALDLVDSTLGNNFPREEVVKCIHIGLLCVQEKAVERPRMTTIVGALSGESISIPAPKLPSFLGSNNNIDDDHHHISPYVYSGTNTITNVYSRD